MSTEIGTALIGVIGTLAGTVLGWLLTSLSQSGKKIYIYRLLQNILSIMKEEQWLQVRVSTKHIVTHINLDWIYIILH